MSYKLRTFEISLQQLFHRNSLLCLTSKLNQWNLCEITQKTIKLQHYLNQYSKCPNHENHSDTRSINVSNQSMAEWNTIVFNKGKL